MAKNADHFAFDGQDQVQNEMPYVLLRLEGAAVGNIQPYVAKDRAHVNLESWKKIIDIMRLAYGDANPKETTRQSLIALYQINKRWETFWSEFHPLGQQAGMESAMQLKYLKDRLSSKIKAQLVNVNYKKMELNKFVNVVQNIATNLKVLNKNPRTNSAQCTDAKASLSRTYSAPAILTVNTTVASIPSTASGTHAGPMDVLSVRRGPLSVEEKEQRNWLNLCRYCGQPRHIARPHMKLFMAMN
ncbi:hypothetical protein MMC07_009854 [Pseudocyphellaria aurata]|nr:hypothetical protein [Pseudocyphellaria aurata]